MLAAPLHAAPPILAAQYNLDEGSGPLAFDSSGNNHLGFLSGYTGFTTPGATPGDPGALSLNFGYVDTAGPTLNTAQSFTVSAEVMLNSLNGYQTFVSADGVHLSSFFLQYISDNQQFAFVVGGIDQDNVFFPRAYSNFSPAVNTWYDLTGIYDASAHTESLYVDGILQQTVFGASAFQATGDTIIGRSKYNSSFEAFVDGEIDNVTLYQGISQPVPEASTTVSLGLLLALGLGGVVGAARRRKA